MFLEAQSTWVLITLVYHNNGSQSPKEQKVGRKACVRQWESKLPGTIPHWGRVGKSYGEGPPTTKVFLPRGWRRV